MSLLVNPSHPGEVLQELYLLPLGLSAIALAKRIHVPRTRIERLVKGEAVEAPDEIAGHIESYARFLDEFDVEPVHVEFSVASHRYGYAGTGDLIARLDASDVAAAVQSAQA